jgi:hypothetical protein
MAKFLAGAKAVLVARRENELDTAVDDIRSGGDGAECDC